MMVRFVRSFQGKASREQWRDAGDVVMLEDLAAHELLAHGVVVVVSPSPEPDNSVPRKRKTVDVPETTDTVAGRH